MYRTRVRPVITPYLFVLAPLLAAALWGGLYVVSKWGFNTVPPLTLAFLRITVGSIALLIIVRLKYPNRTTSRRDVLGFTALGVVVAVSIVTQFVGTDLTTASQGSLITVLTPVFTVALGIVVLGERLTGRLLTGLVLAAVGTIIVLSGQYDLTDLRGGATVGIGMLLIASVTWAVYTVWGKPLIKRYSALETAAYSSAVAVPVTGILVPYEILTTEFSPHLLLVTPSIVVAILYLGLAGTAGAWYLWYKGMEYGDASVVSAFFFAQPVVGAAFGAVFLGEQLGSRFLIGGVVMAVGVYLVATTHSTERGCDTSTREVAPVPRSNNH